MTNRELRSELRHLHRLLTISATKAREHLVIVDKLTAASVRMQVLIKKLRGKRR